MSAPITLPFRLPRPPRTTIASMVTSGSSHMCGWTGDTGVATTPAIAASPTENATVTTLLGAPFTLSPDTAVSAVVDWTTLSHENVTACTRVFLQTPLGFNWTLKGIGVPPANPYNVLAMYKNANGGPGQYRIGVEEVASGPCKQQATLTGATMTVTDPTTTGSWGVNAQVSLWDGATAHVLKPFGAVDAAPGGAYPQLSAEYIVASNPDLIVLADSVCCDQTPSTVGARPGWSGIEAVRTGSILRIDDSIASRWGPRLVNFVRAVGSALRRLEG